MHVIARSTLRNFWEDRRYRDAERPLRDWYTVATKATWRTPADVKAVYGNASFVSHDRVVFNIGGNKYRLVVAMLYRSQRILIKHILTHAEYDQLHL